MTQQQGMDLGTVALGTWSGGRFMHFGADVGEERFIGLFRKAYDLGIRTFVTADVYGMGEADRLLGQALADLDRSSYCLVGAVGHDFYTGSRVGEKGFPRFTDPELRDKTQYASYLQMATEKALQRLGTDYFDLLLLHNPDWLGYSHPKVWEALADLMESKVTRMLGIAPGPANGFTLDILSAFERYSSLIDWVMLILNPLEPWPSNLVLPAAEQLGVKVLARVVDHGGLFLDSLRPGDPIPRNDHRAFRPPNWIEAAQPKLERMREIAEGHGMTLLQLACQWTLAQPAVASVVPTLIQELAPHAKPIESLLEELAAVPKCPKLTATEVEEISRLGDNRGCMPLKGASSQYLGPPKADQWPLMEHHREAAERWGIEPDRDLYCPHDPRDVREIGAPRNSVVQAMDRRLYLQLLAFGECEDTPALAHELREVSREFTDPPLEWVLYEDLADPQGVALVLLDEDPRRLTERQRYLCRATALAHMVLKEDLVMFGRTYATGRDPDLSEVLFERPRNYLFNRAWPWAVWYPLRRKPEFERLPREEQVRILMEHASMGRVFGECDYAHDVRLACYGMDRNDNEFVVGLVGPDLHRLSRLVQEMRKSRQTSEYIQSLGPFLVGYAVARSTDQVNVQ